MQTLQYFKQLFMNQILTFEQYSLAILLKSTTQYE